MSARPVSGATAKARDFLLELRCEEIPARMQAGARAELEKLFLQNMADAGVVVGDVTVWSTPRRLALIAKSLPERTEAVFEEAKGPRTSAPPSLAGVDFRFVATKKWGPVFRPAIRLQVFDQVM